MLAGRVAQDAQMINQVREDRWMVKTPVDDVIARPVTLWVARLCPTISNRSDRSDHTLLLYATISPLGN
jgi:hypothetical protein